MTITPSVKNLVQPQDPQSAPDELTTQDIINVSPRKSTCQKYFSQQIGKNNVQRMT